MPKLGSLGVCLKCDAKIIFNGEEWRHRFEHEQNVAHKAQPKAKK